MLFNIFDTFNKNIKNTVLHFGLCESVSQQKSCISVAKDMDKAALEKLALDNDRVKEFTKGMTVVKSIVVPGKLVNIVVKPA